VTLLPLAAESMGVRSMCTYVETPDVKILFDPGVALGQRSRLLPHPQEYRAIAEKRDLIRRYAEKADLASISHYHFDHYTPGFVDYEWTYTGPKDFKIVFSGKTVYAKDPTNKINFSQRKRGWIFSRVSEGVTQRIIHSDGKRLHKGSTTVKFSQPVPHGPEYSELGWVIYATVTHGSDTIVFAPDVQGPVARSTAEALVKEKPTILFLGGPPTYLGERAVSEAEFGVARENMKSLASQIPTIILDHHLLRDANWVKEAEAVQKAAKRAGNRVVTAAEFNGSETKILEAQRQRLYDEDPPGKEFLDWTELGREKRRRKKPPLT
jgi:uncharacterized protein